jgi:hypothetical protein
MASRNYVALVKEIAKLTEVIFLKVRNSLQ